MLGKKEKLLQRGNARLNDRWLQEGRKHAASRTPQGCGLSQIKEWLIKRKNAGRRADLEESSGVMGRHVRLGRHVRHPRENEN